MVKFKNKTILINCASFFQIIKSILYFILISKNVAEFCVFISTYSNAVGMSFGINLCWYESELNLPYYYQPIKLKFLNTLN